MPDREEVRHALTGPIMSLWTPFDQAGRLVYQKAFSKGLAWIPAGHILRMSPPIIMDEEIASKGLDMIDEAIGET